LRRGSSFAGDKKSELFSVSFLGKYIILEKEVPFTYTYENEDKTIMQSKSIDENIANDISEKFDCKVFDTALHWKFFLLSENYSIRLIPVGELQLSRIGSALFELGEYEATIEYIEEAKKVERSEVWQSSYPYLAAAYWLTGRKGLSKQKLDQMFIECKKEYGYLSVSNETTRGFVLRSMQKVMKIIPVAEREYWKEIVLKIETL